ncbi:hypothetical protein [Porphyromonas sp. COT-290 OH3588]|uniref:hypothetical protein n=1 Tax=Porphyromonas sp. COT-290 OH3588 TaxID=1515617 RepID=UPI0013645167|nr:hypothetical protein [Porphyromonas sp. COT-290 OH3588]
MNSVDSSSLFRALEEASIQMWAHGGRLRICPLAASRLRLNTFLLLPPRRVEIAP